MTHSVVFLKVSLVSKDSSMLDGLDSASIEIEAAKVSSFFELLVILHIHSKEQLFPFLDVLLK